jgi:hypothetical protein
MCGDFSGTPVIDGDASTFTPSTATTGGPCLVEPGDGVLLPNNWVRPRFSWTGGTPPFELTLTSPRESHPLVVFTNSQSWTLDAATWQALAANAWDDGSGSDAIHLTVADADGSTTSQFFIAPASASGRIVYVAVSGDVPGWSWLESYPVGAEAPQVALTVPTGPYSASSTNTQWDWSRDNGGNLSTYNRVTDTPLPSPGNAQCIGCHALVPDGTSVTFQDFYPWEGAAASIAAPNVGQLPAWLTAGGAEVLSQAGLGTMTFSPAHWAAGKHVVVATSDATQNSTEGPWLAITGDTGPANLLWIDVSTAAAPVFVTDAGAPATMVIPDPTSVDAFYANEGTSFGVIARSGDTRSAATPALSHDGTKIAYSSTDAPQAGRLAKGNSDIYTVPFDITSRVGGSAAPVAGASSATTNEYYPDFSPDDRYLAFNTAPAPGNMYYNPESEVDVIASGGGTSQRLAANDPPACTSVASPGVTNSWLRWSPDHPSCGGKTYYWLVFASTRLDLPFTIGTTNFQVDPMGSTSQLYLTALVDDGAGGLKSYPAVYLWPQSTTTANGYAASHYAPQWGAAPSP